MTLQRAVTSVLAQRCKNFELIVVDDGSTDGTDNYLQGLSESIKRVRQTNSGPSAARNRGAKVANGRYLAFLDSDDFWFPWTLSVYTDVLSKTSNPAFMAGKPLRYRNGTPPDVANSTPCWNLFRDYLESGDEWRWWGASSFIIDRQAFVDVGGFSPTLDSGEDADLALRLGTSPGFAQVTSPITFAYHEHGAGLSSDLPRTIKGVKQNISSELSHGYPGGLERRLHRWRVLTRCIRPVALACARAGLTAEGWSLYRSTFAWHVALRRWRFLCGFPLLALKPISRAPKVTKTNV